MPFGNVHLLSNYRQDRNPTARNNIPSYLNHRRQVTNTLNAAEQFTWNVNLVDSRIRRCYRKSIRTEINSIVICLHFFLLFAFFEFQKIDITCKFSNILPCDFIILWIIIRCWLNSNRWLRMPIAGEMAITWIEVNISFLETHSQSLTVLVMSKAKTIQTIPIYFMQESN